MKTVSALLLVAGIVAAQAACPNQCSGHGTCNEHDRCDCFRQTGTTWRQRVGWTGADCSQRTCPNGISFDFLQTNRGMEINPVKYDVGTNFAGAANTYVAGGATSFKAVARNYALGRTRTFNVRILCDVSAGKCSNAAVVQYQWKLSTQSAYSAPAQLMTAGGAASCSLTSPCQLVNSADASTGQTGIYIYTTAGAQNNYSPGNEFAFTYDYQEGRSYERGNSNNAHQEVECSGRGLCDRSTGRCGCFDGFSGEACQRTTCPNDCSGHGVCQDLRRFASDAGSSYSAYDSRKLMGCACDAGFRGSDCSQVECPSGADPMNSANLNDGASSGTNSARDCSGRGLCDYSSGDCKCFKGYFGERCEYQTNFV